MSRGGRGNAQLGHAEELQREADESPAGEIERDLDEQLARYAARAVVVGGCLAMSAALALVALGWALRGWIG